MPLACAQTVPVALLGLSGELPEEEAGRLERHLASCPSCRAETEELMLSWKGLANPPRYQAPPFVLPRQTRRVHAHPMAWAAAALLVLGVSWSLALPRRSPTPAAPRPREFPYALDRELRRLAFRCEKSWRDLTLPDTGIDRDLSILRGRVSNLTRDWDDL